MSDLDVQIATASDPFDDANAEDTGAGRKEYVHIRIQQRNGRKSLTTVQGLKKEFSYNKILKDLRRSFAAIAVSRTLNYDRLFNFRVTRIRMCQPSSFRLAL
ncbi:protein translation factor SUI1 homolog 2-like [Hibiscus syriacus]|uniref:protein translation factor SUI1 homolog 2-like n=1 Tax=Hibiscus syriacus TaxID=106335 RepID=UPI0019242C0A|nr:protein translation factor SUI1 homolog 2-like [Hibiscus syriacus]